VIKNIVSSGCSFVVGVGCLSPNNTRLSALFAKRYNAEDINLAKSGGSNDRIVRKIVNWIVGHKDKLDETLFLIGVSEPKRFEIWAEDDNGVYQDARGYRYSRKRGRYHRDISDAYNVEMSVEATLRNIFLLTTLFEKYNCKYLIFDSIDNIKKITRRKDKYFDVVFGNKNYYSQESWMEFCLPRGKGLLAAEDERMLIGASKEYKEDWRHPSTKGNQKWFEVLIDYVEENKLW
jgi:lysophospholipase L1-like esterase